jgi:hypothetical protein
LHLFFSEAYLLTFVNKLANFLAKLTGTNSASTEQLALIFSYFCLSFSASNTGTKAQTKIRNLLILIVQVG